MIVAGRGADLDDALEDLEDRHVERPAAEVEDQEARFIVEPVNAIGQRRRGRLVEQAVDLEPGQLEMSCARPSRQTPTAELVVPRSIPTITAASPC